MEAVVKHVADKLVRGKLDQEDVAAIAQVRPLSSFLSRFPN
jgi:hypothetical protein